MQTAQPMGVTETNDANAEILRLQVEEQFRALTQKLRKDCNPETEREEEVFRRYAWASFRVRRSRQVETICEERWLANPGDALNCSIIERVIKMAVTQERRADKAMHELRQLQKGRFAAYEVYAEHRVMGKEVNIPNSLPTAKIRRTDLGHTSCNYLAQFLLYQRRK